MQCRHDVVGCMRIWLGGWGWYACEEHTLGGTVGLWPIPLAMASYMCVKVITHYFPAATN